MYRITTFKPVIGVQSFLFTNIASSKKSITRDNMLNNPIITASRRRGDNHSQLSS